MFDRLATMLIRARVPVLLALALLSAWAVSQALHVRFDFSPRSIFLTNDSELEFLGEHRAVFGDEDSFVIMLVEAPDVFTAPVLQDLLDLSEAAARIEHIEGVVSLATMQRISGSPGLIEVGPLLDGIPDDLAALKRETTSNHLYQGRLINEAGTAAAVMARIQSGFVDEIQRRPVLQALEDLAAQYTHGEQTVSMLGVPVVQREYAQLLQNDMLRTVLGAMALVGILLWVMFRSPQGVLLPLTAVGLAMAWTVAYMVLTDDYFNIINSIVPALLLVIAVGDAVHFLTTYYQELGRGLDKQTALRSMVRRVGAACLLTSVTAAIGFASLVVARIDIIKAMGRVAAVGLMLAYVIILFMIPPALSLARVPKAGISRDPREGWVGRLLVWVGFVTTERKVAVLVVTALVTLVSAAGGLLVKTDNFLLEELFPSHPLSQAMVRMEASLSGVMPVEVTLITEEEGGIFEPEIMAGIERIQQEMAQEPFIGHSISVADLVKEIARVNFGESELPDNRPAIAQSLFFFENSEDSSFLDSVVSPDRRRARITGSARDWGTENFLGWLDGTGTCDPRSACKQPMTTLIDQTFGTVDGHKPGLTVKVTGGSLTAARALSTLVEDMLISLGTAFVVITLLMMLLLKSLRIGLMSMLPNILPLLITLGFMGWSGIPIRTSTALIFSVALGVAVNDTIHFLTRYREEFFECHDRVEAVKRTLLSTGRAIIFTSLLLISGFLVMMTTRFVGIFQMGMLGSVALGAALLGDLLLLPVCLVVFRPWSRQIPDAK